MAAYFIFRRPQARCPLLAQSGHQLLRCKCPLLAVKRTRVCALQPSALEAKRQVGPNSVGRTNKHDDNVPAL
jgi:hypothetical protein